MQDYTIFILTNSISDLTKLEFDQFKIIKFNSLEFQDLLKTSFTDKTLIDEIFANQKDDKIERFALIHKKNEPFGRKKIYDIYHFILILFPSTIRIEYMIDFQIINLDIRFKNSFKTDAISFGGEQMLSFQETEIDAINDYIRNYYKDYLSINYIRFAIQNYNNAFDSNYFHFSFIAFCISLESITNGNSELTYRLARNVAIICGKDEETSNLIFENIKKLYALRSKIVHGSDFDDDLVSDYLYYLECIVSKTIAELLIHKIGNLNTLNKGITKLGFGNRKELSTNWKEYKINSKVEKIIYSELKKNSC